MKLGADLFIASAAFVGSGINAGAGGGSFISFPAILATGVPPIASNATNNFAMWLGSFSSTGSFRSEIDVPRPALIKMLGVSAIGSALGAILLLRTTNAAFTGLIPFLLLAATTIFVGGPAIKRAAANSGLNLTLESPVGIGLQLVIAMYGGFFGAAASILILSLLSVLGVADIRKATAFKVLLSTVINGVAVVPFVIAGVIAWEQAIFMSGGAIAGGFAGADLVKRLPSNVVRNFVIVVASAMTLYFFWSTYLRR